MTILLAFLGTGLGKIVAGIVGAFLAAGLAYLRGRSTGKRAERNRQAAREAKARDIHDEIQSDVGSMSSDHIREELAKRASK